MACCNVSSFLLNQDVSRKDVFSIDQVIESNMGQSLSMLDSSTCISNGEIDEDGENFPNKDNDVEGQNLKSAMLEGLETSNGIDKERIMCNGAPPAPDSTEVRGSKRLNESDELNIDNKRSRTVIIDSDDEASTKDTFDCNMIKSEDHSNVEENICISADDGLTSQSLNKKLNCTACNKLAAEVRSHPLLKVIICADCKCFLEEKKHVKVWPLVTSMLSVNYI